MTCERVVYSAALQRSTLLSMKLQQASVVITGANRGLGRALVTASLAAGARRVYAGARDPEQLASLVQSAPDKIIPLALDITDAAALAAAAARASDISIVFNNAGVLAAHSVLTTSAADLARDFEVNVFGTLAATKAFLPALERAGSAGGAAVVNVLSIASFASLPALGGYAAAKSASYSITQALRAELAAKHIAVHAVFPGPIDTDMVRGMEMPKTSPEAVAQAIIDGVERGSDDILPDPTAGELFAMWKRDTKELERRFIAMSGL
jgi:NAD(P)-dependent dehydrogenase (short-subunit alcohol dehydrogenase family)